MGRAPCCDKANVKRGPWSPEEDTKLKEYIEKQGTGGNWIALPQKAGLRRCGKSCRLRWLNYLRPNIKHGEFSDDEDRIICTLFANIGSRWSIIAGQLPGRTDNDIKNYWNTKLKKKLMGMPTSHKRHNLPTTYPFPSNNSTSLVQNTSMANSTNSSPYESGNSSYYPSMPFTTLLSPNTRGCVGPMQGHNSNMLVFGGEAASCSSSDGSCTTNNLIGQGKDQVEQEHIGLQSYFSSGVDDENLKFLIGDEKLVANGSFSEDTLDYSLEEIKQLISTNNICNNNLNFFVDEIKTEDKELYY